MRAKEFVTEAVITALLASWLQREARQWLTRQIRDLSGGRIELPSMHALVDRSVQSMLGPEDPKIGSVITAFILNLIERGNPVEAAVQTAKSELRRAGIQLVGEPVKQAMMTTVNAQSLRDLEPLADRWEQSIEQGQRPAIQPGQPVIEPAKD